MGAVSGKNGTAILSGATLNCHDASVTDTAVDVDGTTFESDGYEEGTIGPEGLSYDIDAYWVAGGGMPPGSYPTDSAAVSVKPQPSGTTWVMPVARILSASNTTPTKGAIGAKISGKSNGVFTRA